MLEVSSLVRNDVVFPRRFFAFKGDLDNSILFPVDEMYRDLLYLVICLHHIECQLPSEREICLSTNYSEEFRAIKDDLERLYKNLTGKTLRVNIRPRRTIGSQETLDINLPPSESILFSGGVDSTCGSIKLVSENSKCNLIHTASSKTGLGKILRILRNDLFSDLHTFCVNSRIKSERNRSFISNTRGLLNLTAGFVVTKFTRSKRLCFSENGAQLLDVMLGSSIYSARISSTKNTNLGYLEMIEYLLRSFDNSDFRVNYLFSTNTKSEIIAKYLDEDLLQFCWSCYSLRRKRMCGFCWNCFITRMSAIATGAMPDVSAYQNDPLIQNIEDPVFLANQNIIYDLLVFYESVINERTKNLEEISIYEDLFKKPIELSTNFGLDIYLGIKNTLSKTRMRSGLGRKAEELLLAIDKKCLEERYEYLLSLRTRKTRE